MQSEREEVTSFSFLVLILIPSTFVPKVSFISISPYMLHQYEHVHKHKCFINMNMNTNTNTNTKKEEYRA